MRQPHGDAIREHGGSVPQARAKETDIKNFDTAARRGAVAVNNPVDITFQIDGEELTAHPPTTGQIALFMTRSAQGGMGTITALFDLLSAVLDDDDIDLVESKLAEGVDIGLLTDIVSYLIEEWSARPTQPSSASSASRRTTGKRSTAKRPATASTP